jgi:hypothetical protein
MKRFLAGALLAGLLLQAPAAASPDGPPDGAADMIAFGPSLRAAGWDVVRSSLLSPAAITPVGRGGHRIESERGVMIWRPIEEALHRAEAARWTWRNGAPPDAAAGAEGAISIAFVFGAPDDVPRSPRRILAGEGRALVYRFGGEGARGAIEADDAIQPGARAIVLRTAADADGRPHKEAVALRRDFERLYGEAPGILLGVAIFGGGGDGGRASRATIEGLALSP